MKVGLDPEVERIRILKTTLEDIRGWGFAVNEGQVRSKPDGETVVHTACAHGRLDVLELILPLDNVPASEAVPLLEQKDDEGFTPLRKLASVLSVLSVLLLLVLLLVFVRV